MRSCVSMGQYRLASLEQTFSPAQTLLLTDRLSPFPVTQVSRMTKSDTESVASMESSESHSSVSSADSSIASGGEVPAASTFTYHCRLNHGKDEGTIGQSWYDALEADPRTKDLPELR